jgi:hypothetical protein
MPVEDPVLGGDQVRNDFSRTYFVLTKIARLYFGPTA